MLRVLSSAALEAARKEGKRDFERGKEMQLSATRVFWNVMGHNRWQDYEDWDQVYIEYTEAYEEAERFARVLYEVQRVSDANNAPTPPKFTRIRVDAELDDDTLVTVVFEPGMTHVVSLAGNRERTMEAIEKLRSLLRIHDLMND